MIDTQPRQKAWGKKAESRGRAFDLPPNKIGHVMHASILPFKLALLRG